MEDCLSPPPTRPAFLDYLHIPVLPPPPFSTSCVAQTGLKLHSKGQLELLILPLPPLNAGIHYPLYFFIVKKQHLATTKTNVIHIEHSNSSLNTKKEKAKSTTTTPFLGND